MVKDQDQRTMAARRPGHDAVRAAAAELLRALDACIDAEAKNRPPRDLERLEDEMIAAENVFADAIEGTGLSGVVLGDRIVLGGACESFVLEGQALARSRVVKRRRIAGL